MAKNSISEASSCSTTLKTPIIQSNPEACCPFHTPLYITYIIYTLVKKQNRTKGVSNWTEFLKQMRGIALLNT
jgi:hypothetical protein